MEGTSGGGVPRVGEIISLAATDGPFFGRVWFPKTCRQEPAPAHREMWEKGFLSSRRYVQIVASRGLAKTTNARLCTAHRISYALSNVLLYIGPNEPHARRSLRWLKRQIDVNYRWASAYGLCRGGKWTDTWMEVANTLYPDENGDPTIITILGMGWESSTRGINVDDFRPDFILLDDLLDPKTTCSSPTQVKKLVEDVNGGLRNSLAPVVDAPLAKMVAVHTPATPGDLAEVFEADPQFLTLRYSILTPEEKSSWEARFPTEEVLAEKASRIQQNDASTWYREMEVTLIPTETCLLRREWLQYWDEVPEGGSTILCIDPVPPPTSRQLAMGLRDKDKEAFVVGKQVGETIYLLECRSNKGHYPDWTLATFWELVYRWKVQDVVVLAVAYEHTLKWLIEQSMLQRGTWLPVYTSPDMLPDSPADRRRKEDRIVQAYRMVAPFGRLKLHRGMTDIIEQFSLYPNVKHEDELEAGAGVVTACMSRGAVGAVGSNEAEYPPLSPAWKCRL